MCFEFVFKNIKIKSKCVEGRKCPQVFSQSLKVIMIFSILLHLNGADYTLTKELHRNKDIIRMTTKVDSTESKPLDYIIRALRASENSTNDTYVPGHDGLPLMHELMGVPHFLLTKYSQFEPPYNYSVEKPHSNLGQGPVYSIYRFIFNGLFTRDPVLPEDYVIFVNDGKLALGQRAKDNDWAPLLRYYWILLLFVLFMLIIIITFPFIAVCYCAYCCHLRCGRYCPTCDYERDRRKRFCLGIILLVLLLLLFFGLFIAFANNRLLEHGFQEVVDELRRANHDICRYLEITQQHFHHLFVNNYQELQTELTETLLNAHKHMFMDLSDTSMASALHELIRIFENMPEALDLMERVDKQEKQARYYASDLKDGFRGIKRYMNRICSTYCDYRYCEEALDQTDMEILDLGCLHYDKLPNTTIFVEAMKDIISESIVEILQKALVEYSKLNDLIKNDMELLTGPMINDINAGGNHMRAESDNLRNLLDAVISDIHLNTLRTSRSFDDVYDRFGNQRNFINVLICLIIFIIWLCLFVGLCCGCFGKEPRGFQESCCNRNVGRKCLLIAIFLILVTFSIIALACLFYFVFGVLTYEGACAPLRDRSSNDFFNRIDRGLDLHSFIPTQIIDAEDDDNPLPPIRLSNTIEACQKNQSIYEVLHVNRLYNFRNLQHMEMLDLLEDDLIKLTSLNVELSHIILLSEEQIIRINKLREGNLSSYHGDLYLDILCEKYSPRDISYVISVLKDLEIRLTNDNINYCPGKGYFDVSRVHDDARMYMNQLQRPLEQRVKRIREIVLDINRLILYKNMNFSDSIGTLLNDLKIAQEFITKFGKEFIADVGRNLSHHVLDELQLYSEMVMAEIEQNVGRCAPLAYIYMNCARFICRRLVDPINGFWFGLLICCVLLVPIFYISHKLQCLYGRLSPYTPAPMIVGCPECTGAPGPYVMPTVVVCDDGIRAKCKCETKSTIPVASKPVCPCPEIPIRNKRPIDNLEIEERRIFCEKIYEKDKID